MHVTNRKLRLFPAGISLCSGLLTVILGAAGPVAAQLVNPAFDSGPLGPVGNFLTVVGPPAQYGLWGAEVASIVTTSACGTAPRSNPNMLRLDVGGGPQSQAWQAVDVSAGPPSTISLRAWANTCRSAPGSTVAVDIRLFNDPNSWPEPGLITGGTLALDEDAGTWQRVATNCVDVLWDTHWILVQVFLVNNTSGGIPVYIDDVDLIFDECPVSIEQTTWSRVKVLMGSGSR